MNLTVAHLLALLAMLLTVLSLNVSRLRLKYGVSYGDDGHRELTVAIRAHGNALEQSLLFAVLVLALHNQATGEAALLAWLGAVFVLARVVHALAMFQRWLRLRQLAHVTSLLAQLTAAGMLLR
ncbi:MAPEG family protein [Polaromonas sp.]|uniref:MAPEG family protein n=1 Tax=Polaromonas sp. TaxID=1869339 RepID=UPI00374FDCBD